MSLFDKLMQTLIMDSTWWEVCWTVPALIALVLRSWLLNLVSGDARHWYQQRKTRPLQDNVAERTWSTFQFIQKLILVLVLASMAIFGLVAMFTPPSSPTPPSPTRVTYTLTVVFILIPSLLTLDAILELVSRSRTEEADRQRAESMRRRRTDLTPDATPILAIGITVGKDMEP